VDSVRKVVDWGRRNMEASGLDGIRWVVEDAATFVHREVKRGKTYQGILLDPPAYGRGPDGEKWVLEEDIDGLLRTCKCHAAGEKLAQLRATPGGGAAAQPLARRHGTCQDVEPGFRCDNGRLVNK
jgi:hypothetical protein